VALVPATGGPEISTVAAFVMVDAATKEYVGAWNLTARCVARAPVANCTVRAKLKFRSVASVDAVRVVSAGPVTVRREGLPVVAAAGAIVNPAVSNVISRLLPFTDALEPMAK